VASQSNVSTLNISLPKPLKSYVDGKVASGIYSSASEFVREAIREKREREQSRKQLEDQLFEGLSSGVIPVTSDYFEKKKRALARRIAGQSRKK
jgi:antitoxin ParD1/3/4